jgi:hypothetical protein
MIMELFDVEEIYYHQSIALVLLIRLVLRSESARLRSLNLGSREMSLQAYWE